MKRYLLRAFVALTAIQLLACNNNPGSQRHAALKTAALNWLIGTWHQQAMGGDLYESWSAANDSLLAGSSCLVKGGDTLFSEKISLVFSAGQILYVPVVSNQNGGKPVTFSLADSSNQTFVFENKTHDFPQRIVYRHASGDSLLASIEGNEQGKFRMEEFRMKRVK